MTHEEAINQSRRKQLVPDDKFDRHMTMARMNDVESRKTILNRHVEDGIEKTKRRTSIMSSYY